MAGNRRLIKKAGIVIIRPFSPDTLDRYSWEEVLAKKKYWFTARLCRKAAIQFPEEFEYMGDV